MLIVLVQYMEEALEDEAAREDEDIVEGDIIFQLRGWIMRLDGKSGGFLMIDVEEEILDLTPPRNPNCYKEVILKDEVLKGMEE